MTDSLSVKFRNQPPIARILAVATFALGCASWVGGWDVGNLEVRYPVLDQHRGQRLGDSPPYLLPHGDSATLFLCRFETTAPIPVSLPLDASAEQSAVIRLALDGWANAGLGISFFEVTSEAARREARIDIRLVGPATGDEHESNISSSQGTGYTVSDCALREGWQAAVDAGGPLPASLDRASIAVRTTNTNMIGQEIPLSDDELVGTLLHELGHALGFPGHLATLDGVMTKSTDTVRTFGRRLRSQGRFASPTLAALYALPSGAVIGRVKLAHEEGALFERALQYTRLRGWSGPFVRVGEEHGTILWRDEQERSWTLHLRGYRDALRAKKPLSFAPSHLRDVLRAESTAPRGALQ